MYFQGRAGVIPLLGEMSANADKRVPEFGEFAPAVNLHRTLQREQAPALHYQNRHSPNSGITRPYAPSVIFASENATSLTEGGI